MKPKLLLIVFMLFVVPVGGQTASEIEQAYGKPTLAYSVTEHIWMTPDFATNGQVCRMRFYPKSFYRDTAYVDGQLNFAELKWILNDVVPPSERGKRKTWSDIGNFTSGIVYTEYEYEKVNFTFAHSSGIRITAELLKKGEFVDLDFPVDAPVAEPPKPPPPSDTDFDTMTKAEVVVLRWNDRTCAENSKPVSSDNRRVAEIEQRFGPPQKVYSVSSGISMTPEFAADGLMCQMWLYPKRIAGAISNVGSTLAFDSLREYLNALVPPADRGLKQEVNFGTTATGGGAAWTTYPYEYVSFTFLAAPKGSRATESEPVLRKGEFAFSVPYQPVVQDRMPSANDFQRGDDVGMVVIRWPHRTCFAF